jgi:hypothetical protein
MYRKPIGPTAHGVIDYAFVTLNTLRASVGSTEAAKDVVARFGGVRPTRASAHFDSGHIGRSQRLRVRRSRATGYPQREKNRA